MLNAGGEVWGGAGKEGEGRLYAAAAETAACARIHVACQTIGIYKVHYRHARTPLLISNTDIRHVLTHAHKHTHSEILEVVTAGRDLHWMLFLLGAYDPSLWPYVLHNFPNSRQDV